MPTVRADHNSCSYQKHFADLTHRIRRLLLQQRHTPERRYRGGSRLHWSQRHAIPESQRRLPLLRGRRGDFQRHRLANLLREHLQRRGLDKNRRRDLGI